MRQQRIRHARREFVRAYPTVGAQVAAENAKHSRRMVRAVYLRNALIVVGTLGMIYVRCFHG